MGYRVGVDIGGTFADVCVFDEVSGRLDTIKVLSTPDTPGMEVVNGLKALEERFGYSPRDITYFTHGTTVGINTIIMRRGIRLCLFTTENFIDVLELARLKMPDPYDLFSSRPEPLVTRDRVLPVRERMLADGTVDTPLDQDSVRHAVERVRAMGADGIVIAFLHAYRNPAHELAAAALITEIAPEFQVFCSHAVRPIIREYERTSTTVIHGYVQPRVSSYLSSLQKLLLSIGVAAAPMITKSNGGVMSAELGKSACVEILLSGTAAGVMGAAFVAREAGYDKVLSLDIGGTSADVAIIREGMPGFGSAEMVGEFPIYVPSVSVTSIGQGGGSIARLDAAGMLCVGPESAGSMPGPAAYGRGGTDPTITDAFVVLGLLDLDALGYGMVNIDRAAAVAVIDNLAASLGLDAAATAEGVIKVAISGMYREISKLCSRRGIDIAEFSLLAFGGGGPMMACLLARDLGIKRVIVPPTPGVLSALGGLTADIRNDFTATAYFELSPANMPKLQALASRLSDEARRWMAEAQGHAGAAILHPAAEMRYRGQSFEIEVALHSDWVASADAGAIAQAFHNEHQRLYGHADDTAAIQIIAFNMVVTASTPKPALIRHTSNPKSAIPRRRISVRLDSLSREIELFHRDDLMAGSTLAGPCVIQQDDTTTIVPDGFVGFVDALGNLILDLEVGHAH